jgi:hypothetical protein
MAGLELRGTQLAIVAIAACSGFSNLAPYSHLAESKRQSGPKRAVSLAYIPPRPKGISDNSGAKGDNMGECVALIKDYWGYIVAVVGIVLLIGGYGVVKLKDFLPVLKTLLSTTQDYPLGTWNCVWQHDTPAGEQRRPDVSDVVTIAFAREEVVIGSGSGGDIVDGYKLVGRCTSSCLAVTYKIADKNRPYAGAVVLHKVTEKRLEGRFVQYIIAPDGLAAGLVTGMTVWKRP